MWLHIEHEGVIETVSHLVIRKVPSIHGDFNRQNVWLGVLGHLNLNVLSIQYLARHNRAEVLVTKPHNYVVAVVFGALEVAACQNGSLIVRALHWAELGRDSSDHWRVVVQITVCSLGRDDRLPLLLVEGEHQNGLGTCGSLGCVEYKGVVVDVLDLLHIANLLASSVLKLSIKGDIITQCAIISLELLEAETAHLNSSVS